MIWQGVPFSSFVFPMNDTSHLAISQIPPLVIDSGFAWETVLATLIAGAIPAFVAWKTIRNNQDSVEKDRAAQLDIASKNFNAQVLSTNRQSWIKELRDTSSDFMSTVDKMTELRGVMQVNYEMGLDHIRRQDLSQNLGKERLAENLKEFERLNGSMLFCIRKNQLLLNPKESQYHNINNLMSSIQHEIELKEVGVFNLDPKIIRKLLNELTKYIQEVLKEEWERVKKGM